MNYIKKAQAAQAFLTGRRIKPEDVLTLDLAGPVRIQLFGRPLAGVSWDSRPSELGNIHHHATVVQDGVDLELVVVTTDVVMA